MVASEDTRPRTAVLHQFTGIGDLVWHLEYFKAVARQSRGDRVTVIAQPSTLARQILAPCPWVEEVIDHDHRPRRGDQRKLARHGGLLGIWRMARELRQRQFDRIVLFSGRPSRGLLAALSGIPIRLGYGYSALQRVWLNRPPYIPKYHGPAVAVLKEVAAFSIAHRFCSHPIIPRMDVSPSDLSEMNHRLAGLPRPLYALAIGTSEQHKQWGGPNFAALATALRQEGCGVVILGGPGERPLAQEIMQGVPAELQDGVRCLTEQSILQSAAALSLVDGCIGNDTGMVNMSAAVGRRTWVLVGNRPLLDHDPLLVSLTAPSLAAITPAAVLESLHSAAREALPAGPARIAHPAAPDR